MCSIATEHFKQLLTAEVTSSEKEICRQAVWEQIQPRVTSVMQAHLLVPFPIEEIYKVLHTLPRHSCSGEDGLSPGFFIKYWELIKIELCEAFQLAFDLGYLLDTWKAGHIFLIPKGEHASEENGGLSQF